LWFFLRWPGARRLIKAKGSICSTAASCHGKDRSGTVTPLKLKVPDLSSLKKTTKDLSRE
jgi:hypothetical protein